VSDSSSAPVRLVVMEGDGIGPEITAATLVVLREADRAFGLGLSFTSVTIGLAALRAEGTTFPAAAVDAARSADGVILGPVSPQRVSAGRRRRHQSVGRTAHCGPGSRQSRLPRRLGAMLLGWLGERRKADRLTRAANAIEAALDRAIAAPEWRTRDLGGPLGTKAFGERVAALVKQAVP
jgi:isocitrate/isopropylmalate dehydrogenase